MLRVHLTFDVEVWCPGWRRLDETFPAAFDRYVWGRSTAGDFGLPRNLEILQRHGLTAVFFVEPLFSLRFGERYLQIIVDLIKSAGQNIQLHVHPEWIDEISPPLLENIATKRQNLTDYSLTEQIVVLSRAREALASVANTPITAFRSGGYAANRQTYAALAAIGMRFDSSLNATFDRTAGSIGPHQALQHRQVIDGVQVHPVTVFQDGRGQPRHLQVGACGFHEMRQVLDQAHRSGMQDVVIVSHNFELLKPGTSEPDYIVERRYDKLCGYLAENADRFEVVVFDESAQLTQMQADAAPIRLKSGLLATAGRLGEQFIRRVM